MSEKSASSTASGSSLKKSASEQWTPEVESLREGIDFINSQAPEGDAQNEQTFWILCNIRHDSGSPISGWPEAKVRFMAQNKSKGLAGAQPQTKFPLTLFSLKPFIHDRLSRIILPLLMTHGLMLLGMPGVGKTPFVIALALAIGRYHVREQALSEPAGWRRARSLDTFRHRNPGAQKAIFLDDPHRGRVDASYLKSFPTVDEDQTCTARYCDVKLTQNGMRAYASNDFDPDDEPKNDTRQEITPEEFQTMAKKIFSGDGISDIMATLKRSIVLIFGKNALYLRLPSENREAIVHRITVDKVHEDLLSEKDKELYGKYKKGKVEYGHHYQSEIERELELISNAKMGLDSFSRPQGFHQQLQRGTQRLHLSNANTSSQLAGFRVFAGGRATHYSILRSLGTSRCSPKAFAELLSVCVPGQPATSASFATQAVSARAPSPREEAAGSLSTDNKAADQEATTTPIAENKDEDEPGAAPSLREEAAASLSTDNKAADHEATTSQIAEGKDESDKRSLGDGMDIEEDVDADEEAARELFE